MILVNLRLAWASIRAAKMRTFLTIIAVIIGIASYTVVTTTVDGLKNAAATEINNLGGNLVQIVPGKVIIEDEEGNRELNFGAGFGSSTITEKDIQDVGALDGIRAIAPLGIVGAQVSRGETVLDSSIVIATSSDFPDAFAQEVANGNFFNDQVSGTFAVIGQGVVDKLYGGELSLGTMITVRGQDFTVVGSMAENESALSFAGGPNLNDAVFISLQAAHDVSSGLVSIQEVDIQLEDGVDGAKVKTEIEEILLSNHGGEEDFTVLTQEEILELTDSIFGIIKQVGQVLSYVMLFVSSIVILLIMLITVRERTKEIGLRKSIGATNANILVQFLAEAVTISWLGSAIGLGVGVGFGFWVRNIIDITPAYTIDTLVLLIVISTGVGVAAGVIPAWIAARKDPVESLRHE